MHSFWAIRTKLIKLPESFDELFCWFGLGYYCSMYVWNVCILLQRVYKGTCTTAAFLKQYVHSISSWWSTRTWAIHATGVLGNKICKFGNTMHSMISCNLVDNIQLKDSRVIKLCNLILGFHNHATAYNYSNTNDSE